MSHLNFRAAAASFDRGVLLVCDLAALEADEPAGQRVHSSAVEVPDVGAIERNRGATLGVDRSGISNFIVQKVDERLAAMRDNQSAGFDADWTIDLESRVPAFVLSWANVNRSRIVESIQDFEGAALSDVEFAAYSDQQIADLFAMVFKRDDAARFGIATDFRGALRVGYAVAPVAASCPGAVAVAIPSIHGAIDNFDVALRVADQHKVVPAIDTVQRQVFDGIAVVDRKNAAVAVLTPRIPKASCLVSKVGQVDGVANAKSTIVSPGPGAWSSFSVPVPWQLPSPNVTFTGPLVPSVSAKCATP